MIKRRKPMLKELSKIVEVDKDKCVNCHACITACPVKYCNNGSNNIVSVDNDMCIGCGECVTACTHQARIQLDDFARMMQNLNSGEKIIAIVAPSVAANFPNQYLKLNAWLNSIGIKRIFDVSFGAELCVRSYVDILEHQQEKTIIAQPCE